MEVNNVLNLTLQAPCVPAVVRQGVMGEDKEEDGRTWNGNRGKGGDEEEAALCFCVSINVRVVKCVQGRRGGWGTGRAPYKRE